MAFGTEQGVDPEQLLDDAFPVLQRFIDAGLLVEAGSKRERRIVATFEQGGRVGEWEILHCLQVLEDVELYQIRDGDRQIAALKIARDDGREIRRTLERETAVLERAAGTIAPRLLSSGIREERPFITMEWRTGASAGIVADELRASSAAPDRRRLLRLCADIAAAYAELHDRGILHGDVHERNLLVDASGRVTILDFGFSRIVDDEGSKRVPRAGVAFYFEPEYAIARRDKHSVPRVTVAGEQYSVAALLYTLFAGVTYLNFSPDRKEALRQIAEDPTLSLADRGIVPFPQLEEVLGRALRKAPAERWPSMADFAYALRGLADAGDATAAGSGEVTLPNARSRDLVEATIRRLGPGGSIFENGLVEAPTTNVNFGAAGVACGLYRMALARESASLLSLADVWATRAKRAIGSRRAFYNPSIGLSRGTIGRASLYHTASGVHVVRALIARAMSDFVTMGEAISSFIAASGRRGDQIDLTLGRASILLGCSLLLEADPRSTLVEMAELSRFGDRIARDIWSRVERYPRIGETSPMESLGIAHGWGGIVYAALRWRLARGEPIDDSVRARLEQLAACAEPDGRGLRWRWVDNGRGGTVRQHGYMGGWCNGSAGFVHLWRLAATACGDERFLELAQGAGWNAWEDDGEETHDLCCGLPGRAYALLSLYRATGDTAWLERAVVLAERSARLDDDDAFDWFSTCSSLYKSGFGTVLLLADLERPDAARMPLFEAEGWPVAP